MPRTGVSYDEVAESIQSLEKAGLKPSIRLIREKLRRGSLSTIAEHKRAYDQDASQGPGEALPDPIARGLIKGAETFWQELVDAAQDEIDAAGSRADARIAEYQARESDLETELAGAKDENGTLVAALAERNQGVTALSGELAEATASLQSAEKKALRLQEQRDAASIRADDKEHQLNALREDLRVTRKEREALDSHLEHQATDHARELGAVMEKLAEEKAARQARINEYKEQLVIMSDVNDRTKSARRKAEKAAVQSKERISEVERENRRLSAELGDSKNEVRLLTEQIGEHRGQLGATKERLAEDRENFERLILEKNEQTSALSEALKEARELVRQYVPKGTNLAQELINERKSGG